MITLKAVRLLGVLSAALLTSNYATAADTGLSASSLKVKLYKFAVSTSPLCTNLQTVVDNGSAGIEINMIGGNGSLGSGSIALGNYPCVVLEIDSVLKFTPSTTSSSGHCSSAAENTLDVCRVGDNSKLIDGSTSSCVNGSDHVALYLSTASNVANSSDGFHPPTTIGDSVHGFNLLSALSIGSSTSSGRFVVNPAGKVCDGAAGGACDGGGGTATSCQLEPPTFAFKF